MATVTRACLAIVWCLSLLGGAAAAQEYAQGTIIIIGYSKEAIIVASDSRVNFSPNRYKDDACKITTLNNETFFTSVGRVQEGGGRSPIYWDADVDAKRALEEAAHMNASSETRADVDLLHLTGGLWGKSIVHEIVQYERTRSVDPFRSWPTPIILEGIFVGFDSVGNVELVSTPIMRTKSPSGDWGAWWQVQGAPKEPTSEMQFEPFGRREIFDELQAGRTERAKTELSKLNEDTKGMPTGKANIVKAMRYVELTSKYTAAQDLVGGPVDVLRLQSGSKHVEWIQRKPDCHD